MTDKIFELCIVILDFVPPGRDLDFGFNSIMATSVVSNLFPLYNILLTIITPFS